MKIKSKEVSIQKIEVLRPHPKNPNKHPDDQIERLCKLIEYQGFRNPVIVQKGTNLIVAGHGRIMAAKKLGMKEVPVIEQEFESEAQLYSYIVSDNAIGKDSWAEMDLSEIKNEIVEFEDLDLEMLGMKDFEIVMPESLETEPEPDYGALGESEYEPSSEGVKKAIMVEFEAEDYQEAFDLIKKWRDRGMQIGPFLVSKLKQEEENLEAE